MRRIIHVVYGTIAYLLFLASFAYFIGFLSGIGVPKSVDSGPATGRLGAVAWNIGAQRPEKLKRLVMINSPRP